MNLIVQFKMHLLLAYNIDKLEVNDVIQDIEFRVESCPIIQFKPLIQRFVARENMLCLCEIETFKLVKIN
jgi:hypothetical protein